MLSKLNITLRVYYLLLFVHLLDYNARACSPLMVPSATSFSVVNGNLLLNVSNTSVWLNCPNVIDVEIACNTSNFSGLAQNTFTSPPQTFNSSPYSYPTQTVSIANLCPGTVYKFRIRERNNNQTSASNWSQVYTFTTTGTFVQPVVSITATPNLICPPAPVQLSAQVSPSCGISAPIYAWFPTTGLSNPNIANPVANITTPTTYTLIVTGGATGCWSAISSIFLNVGTGPPVPGNAVVTPSSLCVYGSATLTAGTFTGNIQWQQSTSSVGPWTNINGATSATHAIASVSATTCYQAIFTSCSGATLASNVACAITNPVPILTPSIGCSNSVSVLSYAYTNGSGTPTSVVWSPAPVSMNTASTAASYTSGGTIFALAFFGDGCIATTSFALVVPSISVAASAITCSALGSATVLTTNMPGPHVYSWLPGAQTGSVATGLVPGTYTTTVAYNNNNCVTTATTNLIPVSPLSGVVSASDSLDCPGVPTGTASIAISGGSGNSAYFWTNGTSNNTNALATGLTAGTHTITVTDLLTFCSYSQTFFISQIPDFTISIAASSQTACVGSPVVLTAQNAGGTPAYSYTWNGGAGSPTCAVTDIVAGTRAYTVNSVDSKLCPSSKTISINYFDKPTISVVSASICPLKVGTLTAQGANSYTWNNGAHVGNTFTASPFGTTPYSVVGEAQTCTNSAIGYLYALAPPNPNILSNSPVCNGQLLTFSGSGGIGYSWTGPGQFNSTQQNSNIASASPTNSGVYTLIVTAPNTCTASTTRSLTVHPTPIVAATGATVCSNGTLNLNAVSAPGATFEWSGPLAFYSNVQNPSIVFPATAQSGNYIVKATSVEGCTNTAIAQVTVTQLPTANITSDGPKCTGDAVQFNGFGGDGYSWSGPLGFSSNIQNPSIASIPFLGGGTYTLSVTTGPCIAFTTHSLTVYALPTVTASNSGNVCETKTLSLYANTGANVVSYLWMGPSFSSFSVNPQRTPTQLGHSGTYTLIVTDSNSCKSSATTSVQILNNPNVAASGATVCLFQPAGLTANGADTYFWEGPNYFQSSNPNPVIPSVGNNMVGIYTVTGRAANNCTTVLTVTVNTKSLPVPSISVSPSPTVCLNSFVVLEGSGGTIYKWFGPNDIYYFGKTATISASTVKFAGDYTLVVTDDEGCYDGVSTTLRIHPLPEGALVSDFMEGCAPLTGEYKFIALNNSPSISSTWEINRRIFYNNFSTTFSEPGIFPVKGSLYDSTTTCRSEKTFFVNVHPVPEAGFFVTPEEPVENTESTIFTNTSYGDELTQYNWYIASESINDGGFFSNNQNASYFFKDAGVYPVAMVVTNTWGCADTIIKVVKVGIEFNVYVPNVFTPNGDGNNDIFIPVTRGVRKFEFTIYNRWGAKIFSSNDSSVGWDGSINGRASKSDTYIWKLNVSGNNGENKQLNGHVTLYR